MTRTQRTEILPELTPKIIDPKFTQTKNGSYWTELDLNIFYPNYFSFQKKLIRQKISRSKVNSNWNWPDPKPNPNQTMLTRNDLNRSQPNPNSNQKTHLPGLVSHYTHIGVRAHTHTHTYMYTYKHMHQCVCARVSEHVHLSIYTLTRHLAYMRTQKCIYTYISINLYI